MLLERVCEFTDTNDDNCVSKCIDIKIKIINFSVNWIF